MSIDNHGVIFSTYMSNHEYFHDFYVFLEVVKLMIFHTNGKCENFSFVFSRLTTCQVKMPKNWMIITNFVTHERLIHFFC